MEANKKNEQQGPISSRESSTITELAMSSVGMSSRILRTILSIMNLELVGKEREFDGMLVRETEFIVRPRGDAMSYRVNEDQLRFLSDLERVVRERVQSDG